MANYRMNKLQIGTNTYECAEWYGVCSTAAGTEAKTVSISGFYSAQLVEGCKVTVRFTNEPGLASSTNLTLNVSSTGAKSIQSVAGTNADKRYAWKAGQIVTFAYYNNAWVIEDGAYADTQTYGKVRIAGSFASASGNDMVRKADIQDYVENEFNNAATSWMWNGTSEHTTLFTGTTPQAANWTAYGDDVYCIIPLADEIEIGDSGGEPRILSFTVGDYVFYTTAVIDWTSLSYSYFGDENFPFIISVYPDSVQIYTTTQYADEYTVKFELGKGGSAGVIMTEPLMDYYLKDNGYLTLADLPVWDGSVT